MSLVLDRAFRVEQRDVGLFSDYNMNGSMWADEGARVRVLTQIFDSPFLMPPVVHCGLSMWDIHSERNSRVDLHTENITATSFNLVFKTWGDTKIARARASWIAIGPAKSPEIWDLDD